MRKQKMKSLELIGGVLIFAALGCSSTLTRDQAKSLIQASSDFEPSRFQLSLDADQLAAGAKRGYWILPPYQWGGLKFAMADAGRVHFVSNLEEVQGRGKFLALGQDRFLTDVSSKAVFPWEIEVTGISGEAETEKTVTYVWQQNLKSMDAVVREFVVSNPRYESSVNFQKFDDGWRIVGSRRDIRTTHVPMPVSGGMAVTTRELASEPLVGYWQGGAGSCLTIVPTGTAYKFTVKAWYCEAEEPSVGVHSILNDGELKGDDGVLRVRLQSKDAVVASFKYLPPNGDHRYTDETLQRIR